MKGPGAASRLPDRLLAAPFKNRRPNARRQQKTMPLTRRRHASSAPGKHSERQRENNSAKA
ncbi:hypothetical protein CEP88_04965 [Roseobacter denitrificans]|nr:hypothetical protein CEP88_04965 [Roseobacter denitrificans]